MGMRRVTFAVVLLALLSASAVGATILNSSTPAERLPHDRYGFSGRALQYETSVILDNLPQPDFATLRSMGIGELGVSVWPDFVGRADWWALLRGWNDRVHAEGFTTMALVHDAASLNQTIPLALASGFNVIGLDELVSQGVLDRARLVRVVALARALNPDVGVSVTEYDLSVLEDIHSWIGATRIPGVQMVSDDYNNLTTAETEITLPPLPAHRHGVWVIFSKDPLTQWDSYERLGIWLTAIAGSGLDILLWDIDAAGTWETNWPLIVARLEGSSPTSGILTELAGAPALSEAARFKAGCAG